jgi:hypothetical protein
MNGTSKDVDAAIEAYYLSHSNDVELRNKVNAVYKEYMKHMMWNIVEVPIYRPAVAKR